MITNQTVGDVRFNYGYGAQEDLATVVSEARVGTYKLGIQAPFWRNTTVGSGTATYDGRTETHAYVGNKLQSVSVSGPGGTATYLHQYNTLGQRIVESTVGAGAAVRTFGYYPDGALHTVTPPDYPGITTYTYGNAGQVETITVSDPAREVIFDLDGKGNVLKKTHTGDTTTDGSRFWTYTRNVDGSIATVVDAKGQTSDYTYSGNKLGLPTLIERNSVKLLDRSYTSYGMVLSDADAKGAATTWQYDDWDRAIQADYPGGYLETWSYGPLNDLRLHVLPSSGNGGSDLTVALQLDANKKPIGRTEEGTSVDDTFTYTQTDDAGNPLQVDITTAGQNYARTYAYDYLYRQTLEQWAAKTMRTLVFDPFGNVLTDVDGEGNSRTYTYYSDNAIKRANRPGSLGYVQYDRDGAGNVICITDDPGASSTSPQSITHYTIDKFNRTIEALDARGKKWKYGYDPLDNVASFETPRGSTIEYGYGPDEYRNEVQLPGGLPAITETRDPNGFRTQLVDARGNAWNATPDVYSRTATATPPAGPAIQVSRNIYGGMLTAQLGVRQFSAQKDARARSLQLTTPTGSASSEYSLVGVTDSTDRSGLNVAVSRTPGALVNEVQTDPGGANIKAAIAQDGNFNIVSTELKEADNADTEIDRKRAVTLDGNYVPIGYQANSASITEAVNGFGLMESHSSPHVGDVAVTYDAGKLPASVTVNGRTTTYTWDDNRNLTVVDPPAGALIEMDYDVLDRMTQRRSHISGGDRTEIFGLDNNGNIESHSIGIGFAADHETIFTYDAANRLRTITAAGGLARSFDYAADDGQIASDTVGNQVTVYSYNGGGQMTGIAVDGGGTYTVTPDEEGRVLHATGPLFGYTYTYDTAKRLTKIDFNVGIVPIADNIIYTPDAAGYGWSRTLPESIQQVQAINDIGVLTSSEFDGKQLGVSFAAGDETRPAGMDRPDSAPTTTWHYNASKEIVGITNGPDCRVTIGRNADTGDIESRTVKLGSLSHAESFDHNDLHWITGETRTYEGWVASYGYREDGARKTFTLNDRNATFVNTPAGCVGEIHNALLGEKLRAPYEADPAATYTVGPGNYDTIECVLTNLAIARGGIDFTTPAVIIVDESPYTVDVTIDSAVFDLHPTAANPLVIRGVRDNRIAMSNVFSVVGVPNVRLQGIELINTNPVNAVFFQSAPGSALASCLVHVGVSVDDCDGAQIVGNTFNYTNGLHVLSLEDSDDVLLRNNIYLNDGLVPGVNWGALTPDSDYNCYWPANINPAETNGKNLDPNLDSNFYILDYNSPVRGTGEPVVGYNADLQGWYRHATQPCMGALEYEIESTTQDAGGRVTQRWVAGRQYLYQYDARGQLTGYTDVNRPSRNSSSVYDHLGRRIKHVEGNDTTWFLYEDGDVIAEYFDEGSDNTIDRTRVYWRLPEIDQRIGFVDIEGGNRTYYYYLCDQVGSVLQVVDEDGDVVNQYDYDAFGNIRSAVEGVENRYTFQGREWDAHAGHYHYRMRTYIPEWGSFTGPDMNLANGIEGEHNGLGSYLFCDNNPLDVRDPLGLMTGQQLLDKIDSLEGSINNYQGEIDRIRANSGLGNSPEADVYENEEIKDFERKLAPLRLELGSYNLRLMHLVETGTYASKYLGYSVDLGTLDDKAAAFEAMASDVSGDKWKGWIPIYGSSRDADRAFDEGRYVAGAFHTGMAVLDASLVTIVGKKLVLRVGGAIVGKAGGRVAAREIIERATSTAAKGVLGEEAGARTLVRAGYEELPARLARNNGFDGVWIKTGSDGSIVDIIITESKFASTGKAALTKTKTMGVQLSDEWIDGNLGKMLLSNDPAVRATAEKLMLNRHLIRTKANALAPSGVNRWNVVKQR